MELIGATASVITLASLFKRCIDTFELFQRVKNQEIDLQKINLKLSIERCRLLIWGQSMGLSTDNESSQNALRDCPFRDVIHDTLQMIVQLFTDSQALALKYGCRLTENSRGEPGLLGWELETPAGRLNAAFDNFKTGVKATSTRTRRAGIWVIQDRKKFVLLVDETRELIDGLQDITKDIVSRRKQDRLIISRIAVIQDPDTLSMISDVCDSDHPAFSDAASCKIDVLSVAPTLLRDVVNWNDRVQLNEGKSQLIDQMEDWTITDYRQNFFDLLGKVGLSEELNPEGTTCDDCGQIPATERDWQTHITERIFYCLFCGTKVACRGQLAHHTCPEEAEMRQKLQAQSILKRSSSSEETSPSGNQSNTNVEEAMHDTADTSHTVHEAIRFVKDRKPKPRISDLSYALVHPLNRCVHCGTPFHCVGDRDEHLRSWVDRTSGLVRCKKEFDPFHVFSSERHAHPKTRQ